jgi:hypothetical protein
MRARQSLLRTRVRPVDSTDVRRVVFALPPPMPRLPVVTHQAEQPFQPSFASQSQTDAG